MPSIDDLFKSASSSSATSKRKLEVPDGDRAYKSSKLAANGSPNGQNATVDDAPADEDDVEAGPSLPPEEDENDDEEGRFFGGGVSGDAREALDYVDQQDGGEAALEEERIDAAWLKRLTTSFERKVVKNTELRSRYEGQPEKFMASEADLDAEIKSWGLLADHAELYPAFARSAAATRLVGLLAHENTDIAIGVIQIISELLDEDVAAETEQWDALASAMLDADVLELLLSNLKRLNEESEEDSSGVYHSLELVESLASQRSIAERIGNEPLLEWLCQRIAKQEPSLSQNKQYAAEVLHVLLQISPLIRDRMIRKLDGVDLYLQLLSAYRKRDPAKDSTEEEYAENLFDGLICLVDDAEGKAKFIDAEGMELILIMLKEGKFSKSRALRILDHVVGGKESGQVCAKLVEAAGLKTLFGLFMKKADTATIEHLIGIFGALLTQLPQSSDARVRLLAKFEEKDLEKVKKLVQLRGVYARRLDVLDEGISLEKRMMDEEDWPDREPEWYSRRLEEGLFSLRMIDVILAWLLAEDIGARSLMDAVLPKLKGSLEAQAQDVDDEDTKGMLTTLLTFV